MPRKKKEMAEVDITCTRCKKEDIDTFMYCTLCEKCFDDLREDLNGLFKKYNITRHDFSHDIFRGGLL